MSGARNINFDIIASTGRTATTYIASMLNRLEGVLACHEGYPGSEKETDTPALPLINLENAKAYAKPQAASDIVQDTRSPDQIREALKRYNQTRLIDVAYYNPTLALALLEQHQGSKMLGIIRDCASFVQSATTLTGEDPLPVGWPDPEKELTPREKFIAMGRIRPRRGSEDKAQWANWNAIRRNIWLWHQTNLLLCAAKEAFPDRVALVRFEALQRDPTAYWTHLTEFFDLPQNLPKLAQNLSDTDTTRKIAINKKPSGYQIGPVTEWSTSDQDACGLAQKHITERARYEY